jgi:hypothetical protein
MLVRCCLSRRLPGQRGATSTEGCLEWRIFWALRHAMDVNSHTPTVRELAQLVGLPIGTVHYHLKWLKTNKCIDWPGGKACSITILLPSFAFPASSLLTHLETS